MATSDPKQIRQSPVRNSDDVLERALSQWKSARGPVSGLSPATRGEILRTALESRPEKASYRPLLGIIPRRILSGAIPALALGAVLVLVGERMGGGSHARPLSIRAAKNGDDVVFTIANGGRPHRVLKSTVPTRFDPTTAVTVRDGAYRDATDDGSGLVFYRID